MRIVQFQSRRDCDETTTKLERCCCDVVTWTYDKVTPRSGRTCDEILTRSWRGRVNGTVQFQSRGCSSCVVESVTSPTRATNRSHLRCSSTAGNSSFSLNVHEVTKTRLTPSTPAVPNCCCSKGSAPCWSNPPFLIIDIRALWRSVLSARAPECQK